LKVGYSMPFSTATMVPLVRWLNGVLGLRAAERR
jgi:hypothetical protein